MPKIKLFVLSLELLIISFLFFNCGSGSSSPIPTTFEVTFSDTNLEQVIRNTIGKDTETIYNTDLISVTQINGNDTNISTISGLEYCVNLNYLYFGFNQVNDITSLQYLTNLYTLHIPSNHITDISVLQNLTFLRYLDLGSNLCPFGKRT